MNKANSSKPKPLEGLNNVKAIWRLKDVESTTFKMISEFIDNSIATWGAKQKIVQRKNQDFKYFDCHGLVINILSDGDNLYVSDNSIGMDAEGLTDALIFHNSDLESDEAGIHQYGVGFKFASFWFAPWVQIFTWKEGRIFFTEINLVREINTSPNKVVEYTIFELNKEDIDDENVSSFISKYPDSGSIFVMRDCHSSRNSRQNLFGSESKENIERFKNSGKKPNNWSGLNALGWKYEKFIVRGLSLKVKIENIADESEIEINDYVPWPENIKSHFGNENLGYLKFIQSFNDEVSKKDLASDDASKKIFSLVQHDKNISLPFIYPSETKILDDPKINYISGEIQLLAKNNISSPISFIKGMAIYHKGRAILSGTQDFEGANAYLDNRIWPAGKMQGGGIYRRITGWLNLDHASDMVNIDANKGSFTFIKKSEEIGFLNWINNQIGQVEKIFTTIMRLQNTKNIGGEELPKLPKPKKLPEILHEKEKKEGIWNSLSLSVESHNGKQKIEPNFLWNAKENEREEYFSNWYSLKLDGKKFNVFVNVNIVESGDNNPWYSFDKQLVPNQITINFNANNELLTWIYNKPITRNQVVHLHRHGLALSLYKIVKNNMNIDASLESIRSIIETNSKLNIDDEQSISDIKKQLFGVA